MHPWVGLRCVEGRRPGQGAQRVAGVRCGPDVRAGLAVPPWVGFRCVGGRRPGQGAQRVAGVRSGPGDRCAAGARCALRGPDVRNGSAAASSHHAVGGCRVAGARRFRRARDGRSSPQRVGRGAIAEGRQADVGQYGGQSGCLSGRARADPYWGRRGLLGVCRRLVCGVVAWRIPCGRAAGLSKREGADVSTGPPLSFG